MNKEHFFRELCMKGCSIAEETADFIRKEMLAFTPDKVEIKGHHDFVTWVDKEAEHRLTDSFSRLLPGAGFIVEEKSIQESEAEFQWIIDPLDGTTNFIHGVPLFSISIALHKEGNPLLGIIYEVNQRECFYSWIGGSAYLNGNIIRVSNTARLADSLLATGFPCVDYGRLDGFMELLRWSMLGTRGLRRLGSAALDLAWVACGRFDGFFEYGLNPWDVAAGAFLVSQAGGKNSDFIGRDDYVFGQEIISTNEKVFRELLLAVNLHLAIK